ncbi:MAG: hypothetical protein AAFO89_04415 [Planctomycetota bacterium]
MKQRLLMCGSVLGCWMLAGCGGGSDDAREQAREGEASIPTTAPAATAPPASPTPPADADGEDRSSLMLSNFAGDDFTPVRSEGDATYRLERTFVENMMIIKAMPTYDQGMGLAAEDTPLDRYTFNYYRRGDNSLALSVGAIVMSAEPSQWAWDGAGVWYDERGLPTAKGNFDSGRLDGVYEAYDTDGNVVETVMYDAGVAYDPNRFAADVFEPLVGTWYSDTVDGGITKRLVNDLRDDGTMVIYTQTLISTSFGDSGYMESSRTDDTVCAWVFRPDADDPNAGMMEYYIENELLGRSRVELPEPGVMESRAVFHQSPAIVGTRWRFVKADG